jgi:hypothetical protein
VHVLRQFELGLAPANPLLGPLGLRYISANEREQELGLLRETIRQLIASPEDFVLRLAVIEIVRLWANVQRLAQFLAHSSPMGFSGGVAEVSGVENVRRDAVEAVNRGSMLDGGTAPLSGQTSSGEMVVNERSDVGRKACRIGSLSFDVHATFDR